MRLDRSLNIVLVAAPLLLAALSSALLLPAQASACSCVMPPAPRVALQESAAVFEGRVISTKVEGDMLTATLEVLRVWKGQLGPSVDVTTIAHESVCGYPFEVGGTHLIYAQGSAPSLSTGLCTRTRQIGAASEDLAALGAPARGANTSPGVVPPPPNVPPAEGPTENAEDQTPAPAENALPDDGPTSETGAVESEARPHGAREQGAREQGSSTETGGCAVQRAQGSAFSWWVVSAALWLVVRRRAASGRA